ncbi:hypothetical protein BV22DRAFT_1134148 [Leucogyrophana mollusca]|uniref:Uncharacterized protein n=1 Tax=Leucogyrophana mollusca TaxID=85980 RepID=A0ACB8B035_9AGAM|nr:hypothetical protein BV22DRAFT_1134148 [Leucogyrophana mollusca]
MAKETSSAKPSVSNRPTPMTPRPHTRATASSGKNLIQEYLDKLSNSPSPSNLPRTKNDPFLNPVTPVPPSSTPPPLPPADSQSPTVEMNFSPFQSGDALAQGVEHSIHASPSKPTGIPDAMDDHTTHSLSQSTTNLEITQHDPASAALMTPPLFTPTPDNAFPIIHMAHSAQMFDHLDPTIINAWIAVPDHKFLVRVFNYDGKDPIGRTPMLAEHIRGTVTMIANHHNISANIRVSPPAATRNKEHQGHPLSFLVHNVPNTVKGIIVSQHIWSSPTITFKARDFDTLQLPTIIFALQGFTTDDPGAIHKIIFDTWAMDETRGELVDILSETDMAEEEIYPKIVTFIQSINVKYVDWKIHGGIPLPCFNVFTPSPTYDPAAWTKIRAYLRSLHYTAPLEGHGFAAAFVPCQICNSVDHPRGMCPFPKIPLWNGPTIQNRPRTNTTRGRGGRGRGMRGSPITQSPF